VQNVATLRNGKYLRSTPLHHNPHTGFGAVHVIQELDMQKGGYGEPIRSKCDICEGKLTHKEMVNPCWLSTDWKYVCGDCFGKVIDSWRK